jgi:hypothetical protein
VIVVIEKVWIVVIEKVWIVVDLLDHHFKTEEGVDFFNAFYIFSLVFQVI